MIKTSKKKAKKKTGKKSALVLKREKFKPKLKALIESIGEWNINYNQLEREWGVPDSTLHRWKDDIIAEIGVIDISNIGREICHGAQHNLKYLQKLMLKEDSINKKLAIIKAMNETAKSLTDFLESYNYKVKISEKIDIGMSSAPITVNIVKNNGEEDQDD